MKHLLLLLSVTALLAACSTFRRASTPVNPPPESNMTPRAASTSSTSIQMDYIGKYKDAAVSEMQRAGIPASITLAQGILESAAGQSELAASANNHFGIKCGNDWPGKSYHKKDDDKGNDGNLVESCFRKYNRVEESFFDHSEFLRDPRKSNRYGFLFNLDRRDYKSWARGLQSAGYATSSTYSDQLIDLIERLRLYEYDQPGGPDVKPGSVIPASIPPQQRIGRVNDVKVVNSREGETLADIARIYKIDPEKVADFNDRSYLPGEKITAGTRVYIQEKRDSWHGQSTHHFVADRQTMLDIAQLYGIKEDALRKRNGLAAGQEPAANEKVRLRGRRASGETLRLRGTSDDPADPTPATAPSPGSMTTDESNVLFEVGTDKVKPTQPDPAPSMPGKPATTGVPYPADPVPVSTGTEAGGNTQTPGTATAPQQPQPAAPGYHLVVKGDTLYNISKRYNTSVARIKQLNNLQDDSIKIGQTLRVQ